MDKQFILECLEAEQKNILHLMETGRGTPETLELDWALETVVGAVREFRTDHIGEAEALRRYQSASNASTTCGTTLLLRRIADRKEQGFQAANDQLRQWYENGWIETDADGVFQWTTAGRANVPSANGAQSR